jgi:leader peptidase (prepilin peptidase) / N-methyltransferase
MAHPLPTGTAAPLMKNLRGADFAVGAAGLLAVAASIWTDHGLSGSLGAGLALLMLAVAVADFRHMIIPNALSAAALALGLAFAAIVDPATIVAGVAAAILRGGVTMLLFLAIRAGYGWLRRREGIGLGDVKLAFVAGVWLDWVLIPVAIEIAAVTALTAYVVVHVVAKRPLNAASRLPFGVFFAPAIWLSWLLGEFIAGSI